MIDLDPIITAALDDAEWDSAATAAALESVASRLSRGRAVVDWDDSAEDWGRVILNGKEVIALVCRRMPLGILLSTYSGDIPPSRPRWLPVERMSQPQFRVERALLERAFGRVLSDNVDYGRLSADDLWWVTV